MEIVKNSVWDIHGFEKTRIAKMNYENVFASRSRKSRKTSQYDNLQDCFNRLWLKSDPVIRKCFGRKHCTRYIHNYNQGNFTFPTQIGSILSVEKNI